MNNNDPLDEEQISTFIQLCLSENDVPDEELKQLEKIMDSDSTRAREIALRLLDENMIRSWFRSEADSSFINEVQKRLNIRFHDKEFIDAVMSKVEDGISKSSIGEAGVSHAKEEIKPISMLKYIFVPLAAVLIYLGLFHFDFIKSIFRDAESHMMTVQQLEGRPTLISANKRKNVIRKMIIKLYVVS